MKNYSDFIDRILRADHLLGKLTPQEALDWEYPVQIREADEATLTGGKPVGDAAMLALVRGGLYYAVDALDAGHAIFQNAGGDLGSYWHGMMHRREGDFDNARYWFRRAGTVAFFNKLHGSVSAVSADQARQGNWDPYLFTGQCEQARFGEEELRAELVEVQRMEFAAIFDYCWRQARVG